LHRAGTRDGESARRRRPPGRGAAAGGCVPRPRDRRHHRELCVRDHRQFFQNQSIHRPDAPARPRRSVAHRRCGDRARDWYYNQRRQLGLDSAVASIYDRHDDSDLRARAALTMLGVRKGWRLADIGCGNGVLACEAALMGAEVDAIDISPAMLALANIQARDRKVAIRTQPAGMLSFAYQPNSYDLIVSEFTLHHLPDFWKAVALARIYAALKPGANFYLRDIVFVSMPDGTERDVEQWADFTIKNHDF